MVGFAKLGHVLVIAAVFSSGMALAPSDANARTHALRTSGRAGLVRGASWVHQSGAHHGHGRRYAGRHGGAVIQCVAFARADTGIALSGNAANWWDNAEGIYARGSRPEPGSVLAFRASFRMRLGHVAVVSDIIDSRTVEIDQAHWRGRGISRNVPVVDVSPDNDWTQVRVGIGGGDFGSIYPTHGFIYPRAEGSLEVAEAPARPASAAPSMPSPLMAENQMNSPPMPAGAMPIEHLAAARMPVDHLAIGTAARGFDLTVPLPPADQQLRN